MSLVRPWLGGVAIVALIVIWLGALAWSVQLRPSGIYDGLGQAASAVRLDGIAIWCYLQSAEQWREQVRELRASGAAPAQSLAARSVLANRLRAAWLVAASDGQHALGLEYLRRAVRAAPERVDLRCLLIRARADAAEDIDQKMELLRLAYRHEAACALWMLGELFWQDGQPEAAETYLQRAVARKPELAGAHLVLAQIERTRGDRKAALEHAVQALAHARALDERLAAAVEVTASGGGAPSREQIIGEYVWGRYGWGAVSAVALVLFVVHPALIELFRRRRQRSSASNAS